MDSTTNESTYSLFSIRQAARACNLSRSSLIRLEERGLLTPACTALSLLFYGNSNNSNEVVPPGISINPTETGAVYKYFIFHVKYRHANIQDGIF